MTTIKQEIRNRWTNAVQFTADITCAPDATIGVRIGLAVMWARQNDADLSGANLSGCKGLLKSATWMKEKFEYNELGYIVYKRIGKTSYPAPDGWVIKPGQYLEEVCNPLPTLDCACGVNFATREWCDGEYKEEKLWECIITWQDAASIVVPYNTNGKARCERLLLVRVIT